MPRSRNHAQIEIYDVTDNNDPTVPLVAQGHTQYSRDTCGHSAKQSYYDVHGSPKKGSRHSTHHHERSTISEDEDEDNMPNPFDDNSQDQSFGFMDPNYTDEVREGRYSAARKWKRAWRVGQKFRA